MNATMVCIALLGPLLLVLGALAPARLGPPLATRAVFSAAAALASAIAVATAVAVTGTIGSGLAGGPLLGLSIQVDVLSAILLVLVSFIGLIVVRYSRNYMDGDPGQARFTRWLLLALASVLALLLAGHMVLFVLAWIATSLCLNKLLLFYPERRAAVLAARKKYVASRLADVMLITACVLLYNVFGTLDIAAITASAEQMAATSQVPFAVTTAGILIVLTALLKSAQLPLHGWLIEVMETPTPVSALLHAGIINAGGYLVLRFADVLVLAPSATELLAVIGGATALFASLVMLTQTSVKSSLAWSTIAQMGFMLLQCGLGAYTAALLHIVAHSLYKAHAFLSSGSVVALTRASWQPAPNGAPRPLPLALLLLATTAATCGIGFLFGAGLFNSPGKIVLAGILTMSVAWLMANAVAASANLLVISQSAAVASLVAVAYFALQAAMEAVTSGSLPPGQPLRGGLDLFVAILVVVSFGGVLVLQSQMSRRPDDPFWRAVYVHLASGFYLNTLANRMVLSMWRRERPAKASAKAP